MMKSDDGRAFALHCARLDGGAPLRWLHDGVSP